MNQNHNRIIIVDFGSQVTKLIARRIREMRVYCAVVPYHRVTPDTFWHAAGIIMSGGPASVNQDSAPECAPVYEAGLPILGICYGMHRMIQDARGSVAMNPHTREFGARNIEVVDTCGLTDGVYFLGERYQVWMSHGDTVTELPPEYRVISGSANTPNIIAGPQERYGVQFHPEVVHTEHGDKLLRNFVFNICECKATWRSRDIKEQLIDQLRLDIGTEEVLCALSGGVDSMVTAVLLHQAIGKQLKCVIVDTGLMRLNEVDNIVKLFEQEYDIDLQVINAQKQFLRKLRNVTDPERKRKAIGREFIRLFEQHAPDVTYLAQGTLYPDVIESQSATGDAVTIKSHHNVGGLPEHMDMKLIEPLRELFKDEVRDLGRELGIPEHFVDRHPFPGPGLGIRILGAVTEDAVKILQQADHIFISKLREHNLYHMIWQAFAVLLPQRTVGVQGDGRTYEQICVLRAVTSQDGMTADAYPFDPHFVQEVSNEIINKVQGINRVCYDYTSKPPGTIEFE